MWIRYWASPVREYCERGMAMRRDGFTLPLLPDELIIDNFAGGGGTSSGLEAAFGRPVDVAINHDPVALAMHRANHPATQHLCESVWDVDPRLIKGAIGLVEANFQHEKAWRATA